MFCPRLFSTAETRGTRTRDAEPAPNFGRNRRRRQARTIRTALSVAVALVALLGSGAAGAVEGKYERLRAKRGEQTDTNAKLSTHAFINDTEEPPLKLTLFVDAFSARRPTSPTLLPLFVGMSYEGNGAHLPLQPTRFRLTWTGAETPVRALANRELTGRPGGAALLRNDARMASIVQRPIPYGEGHGFPVPTRFYADPSATTLVNDDTVLTPGSWFVDRLYFEMPEGVDRWTPLFELSYVDDDGQALLTTAFRIEPDPRMHRRAFRKARKQRARADKRARREERRRARANDDGSDSGHR